MRVADEGQLREIGITAYHSPHMSANILSYHKLQETHRILYNEDDDALTQFSRHLLHLSATKNTYSTMDYEEMLRKKT